MTNLSTEMMALVRRAAAAEQESAQRLLRTVNLDQMLFAIQGDAMERLRGQIDASPLTNIRECEAGCSKCCLTVSVDATGLEAIAVAEYLRESVKPDRREQIVRRLEKSVARRESMSHEERANVRMACAFLDRNGLCSVYDSRPLVCAGVFSLSKRACEDAYEADALAAQQVPLDQPAKLVTMGTSAGLQRALVESGLDGNLYELHSASYRAVKTPNAIERYFSGEDIFAGCLCTDAHSPPRVPPTKNPVKRRVDEATGKAEPHMRALSKKERKQRKRLLSRKQS